MKAVENVTIEPRCRQIVTGRLEGEKGQSLPSLVCVEPAHIPLQGVLPARVLTRVGQDTRRPSQLSTQPDRFKAPVSDSRAYVMLANFSDTPLVIPKSTVVEQVSETLVDRVNASRPRAETGKRTKNEALYRKLLETTSPGQ